MTRKLEHATATDPIELATAPDLKEAAALLQWLDSDQLSMISDKAVHPVRTIRSDETYIQARGGGAGVECAPGLTLISLSKISSAEIRDYQMADAVSLDMQKLNHVKAPNFINEAVDRFSLTGFQNGNMLSIILTVGRDTVDITHETVIPAEQGGGMKLDSDAVVPYRIDFATMTLSVESARSLAEALMKMVSEAPKPDAAV